MKKNQANLTWQDVYEFPLRINKYCPFMVLTPNFGHALDFVWQIWEDYDKNDTISETTAIKIVNKINGDKSIIIDDWYNFSYDGNGRILAYSLKTQKQKKVMMIRGWGHLTGTGSLNLPNEVAIKIQDDFGKYIVETLNQ